MGTRYRDASGTRDLPPVPRAFAKKRCAVWSRGQGLEAVVSHRSSSWSSMARRTARELLNLVLGDQASAELELIGRRSVVDTEHRFTRPHIAVRIAMAVEAPFHLQRVFLPHQRHAIDLAVA